MSVMRVHKTANFTVMSNYHFKEKGMSLKAKGLLSLMLSLPEDWNYSVSGLVKLSKDGKDSVMSALSELETHGYLIRTRLTNSKGQFQGIEYNIYEAPQRDKPVADNATLDNQPAEIPNADNQPQLNTNSIKDFSNKGINELNTILTSTFGNPILINLYNNYIEMRETIKAPLTAKGLEALIQRGIRLSKEDDNTHCLLLETAIINNWKNIYAPSYDTPTTGIIDDETLKRLKEFYEK